MGWPLSLGWAQSPSWTQPRSWPQPMGLPHPPGWPHDRNPWCGRNPQGGNNQVWPQLAGWPQPMGWPPPRWSASAGATGPGRGPFGHESPWGPSSPPSKTEEPWAREAGVCGPPGQGQAQNGLVRLVPSSLWLPLPVRDQLLQPPCLLEVRDDGSGCSKGGAVLPSGAVPRPRRRRVATTAARLLGTLGLDTRRSGIGMGRGKMNKGARGPTGGAHALAATRGVAATPRGGRDTRGCNT